MLQLKNRSLLTNPTVSALLPDVLAQSKAARSVRPKLKPRRTLPAEAPQLPEPKPLKILSGPKLEAVADAPPPILLPEPRAAQSGNKAIPPSEVEYTQSLPDVTPTRKARKEFGEQPIEEFKRIAPLPEYEPLSKEKRTGFKGRAKGVWNALQNAGAAGADGTAVIGALVGGAISPERANYVKWRQTVEAPARQRRAAEEESIIRRQKVRNETENVETDKEKADHLFYATDAEREAGRLKMKGEALQRQDKMGFDERTKQQEHNWKEGDDERKFRHESNENALDRTSAETLARIQADTSRQNNLRTTTTSRRNAQDSNATRLRTSKRYPRRLIPDLAKKLGETEGDVEKRLLENGYPIED
jgi:hypothetical protein